jgi:hypothetical protein
MLRRVISNLLGLAGAAVGGVMGYYAFAWLVQKGWYGLMIPGAFLGFGCSLLALHPSIARGIFCGIAALGLGLFAEWKFFPMVKDDSFQYFLEHVKDLSPVPTILMIAIGTLIAFWMGKDAGFRGYVRSSPPPEKPSPPPEPQITE